MLQISSDSARISQNAKKKNDRDANNEAEEKRRNTLWMDG